MEWNHIADRRHRLPGELSEKEHEKRHRPGWFFSYFIDEGVQYSERTMETLRTTMMKPGAVFKLNTIGDAPIRLGGV